MLVSFMMCLAWKNKVEVGEKILQSCTEQLHSIYEDSSLSRDCRVVKVGRGFG